MIKAWILKIIVAICMTLTVVAASVLLLLPRCEWYHTLYERQAMEDQSGISSFEAGLNYDLILDQITGKEEITGMATYVSSTDLLQKIRKLQIVYQTCQWIGGIGCLLSILGLVILRKQKWYEALGIGGYITIASGILPLLIIGLVKPWRQFVMESQYHVLLQQDPLLVSMLPEHWAFYMVLTGIGFILMMGIAILLLHFGSRKEYKPHQF